MKRILLLAFISVFFCAVQVSAKDLRKVVFKVVQMECANCEGKVKKNIPFEKGVKRLDTDLKRRTVTITYDAEKTNVEELKKGFAKFNYDAKVISDEKVEKK